MNRQGVWGYLPFAIVFFTLVDPSVVFPREERAYIEFKRVGISRHHTDFYTVKKGECLFNIVRRNYDVSERETLRLLDLVGHLNPQLKDLNRIYPGQRVLLPRKRERMTSDRLPGKKDENGVLRYVVKKGESISFIIHRFGNSGGEIYRVLEEVKLLNPEVKNFDRIYPGQILFFPSAARTGAHTPAGDRDAVIPEERILPLVNHIIGRMQGVVITEGSCRIPVSPSGEVAIDCSKIPVIEIPGGNTILLDLSRRISGDLKRIIESAWDTYRVVGIGEKETVSSLLERIVRATGVYALERIGRRTKIGDAPTVRVFVELLVTRKPATSGPGRYAVNVVTGESEVLPLPVKGFARRNGLEISEIMDGFVITGSEAPYQKIPPVQVLDAGNGLVLAYSLLKMLGYAPMKGSEITVMSEGGCSLSLKTELLLNSGDMSVIITSQRLSDQILSLLQKRGDRAVFVSGGRDRRGVIEDIACALEIPFLYDNFRFTLSRHTGEERGDIFLPALRLGGEEGLYLVDYGVDEDIRKLLHKEWKVTLVQY